MARKGWNSLSPIYKKRLEKSGISQADYEGGRSLSKARGHERTPEHPTTTVNRSRYPSYYAERERLIQELQAKKERLFGERPRWSEHKSVTHIRQKPVSNTLLKKAIAMSEEEMVNAIRKDSETFYFLGYH